MARLWMMAFLAFMATNVELAQAGGEKEKEKDFQFAGKLTKDDPKDEARAGPSQSHVVTMKAGKVYTIDMVSTEFDSYLRLLDGKGNQLAEDDDSGGNLNARIIFTCPQDGQYKIVCTSFGATAGGSYTLTVKTGGMQQLPSTAHARMIGPAAPDFQADFAVNGKTVTLADLKGKVVLLDFWEVRSSTCVQSLPRLAEWNKAYKADGLVIVGITFYLSDVGQNLGFDRETGKVKRTGAADRKSDRALLEAFAAHHKVDHLLMALPEKDALDAFAAYVVNSLPQLVLIDREGVVRLIEVGGQKSGTRVEDEIKKLLAEK
jgi:thiol-disulfide isomerase/thioredoxin